MNIRTGLYVSLILVLLPAMVFAGGQREERGRDVEHERGQVTAEQALPGFEGTIALPADGTEMTDAAAYEQYGDRILSTADALAAAQRLAGDTTSIVGVQLDDANGFLVYEAEAADGTVMILDAADGSLLATQQEVAGSSGDETHHEGEQESGEQESDEEDGEGDAEA